MACDVQLRSVICREDYQRIVRDPNFIQGNPDGAMICAVTRTYNVGSELGTYGQTVPSLGRVLVAS